MRQYTKIQGVLLLIFIQEKHVSRQTIWHPQRSGQIFLIHIGGTLGVNSGHTSNRECIN